MNDSQIKADLKKISATFTPTEIGKIIEFTAFGSATVYNYIAGKGRKKSTKIAIINASKEVIKQRELIAK